MYQSYLGDSIERVREHSAVQPIAKGEEVQLFSNDPTTYTAITNANVNEDCFTFLKSGVPFICAKWYFVNHFYEV